MTSATSVPLTASTRRLWGKSDRQANTSWLPLYVHLSDAGRVAGYLWDDWLPQGTRDVIAKEFGDPRDPHAQRRARQLLVFLASIHDLGKATPVFQSQPTTFAQGHEGESLSDDHLLKLFQPETDGGAGFTCSIGLTTNKPTHAIAGQVLLRQFLEQNNFPIMDSGTHKAKFVAGDVCDSLACILGGHHGKEPTKENERQAKKQVDALAYTSEGNESNLNRLTSQSASQSISQSSGLNDVTLDTYCTPWNSARTDLIRWALSFSRFDMTWQWKRSLSAQTQTLLTGCVIMADWIASDQDVFPLVPLTHYGTIVTQDHFADSENHSETENPLDLTTTEGLKERVRQGWKAFGLEAPWKDPDSPTDINQLFHSRFGLPDTVEPRPVQNKAFEIAANGNDPRLLVIEAPMGEGKTEAALAAAEVLARRTGRSGVCVALPTMATTDAMFSRVVTWLHHLPESRDKNGQRSKTVYLAHSNAALNPQFARIAGISRRMREEQQSGEQEEERAHSVLASINEDEENAADHSFGSHSSADRSSSFLVRDSADDVIASDWMWGRKKGILSNFVICTVDQVLMASLRMKHAVLRDLALANKVIVIDECHAYDSYMRCYLQRALEWFGSCGTPVILLSATLPQQMKERYVTAYRRGYCSFKAIGLPRQLAKNIYQPSDYQLTDAVRSADGYPLITALDGEQVKSFATPPAASRATTVTLHVIGDSDHEFLTTVLNLVKNGGCCGVICDTVKRAQEAYDIIKQSRQFDPDHELRLLHSRFINVDRMQKEGELRKLIGPPSPTVTRPRRLVVIGTQVLEQSLDIDFDAMITDIAPVDLLFQRLGRLHRHHRGDHECERPENLRTPHCFIRGIQQWDGDKPLFEMPKGSDASAHNDNSPRHFTGISWSTKEAKGVYPAASLYETLDVLGLHASHASCTVHLPSDIASCVRRAYDPTRSATLLPSSWQSDYQIAVDARADHEATEERKAQGFLMSSIADLSQHQRTLMQNNERENDTSDEDAMIRAVRDTQETLSVLVFHARRENGTLVVRLLPWLGGQHEGLPHVRGGSDGMRIPLQSEEIHDDLGRLAAQCSVSLPHMRWVTLEELTAAFEDADGQLAFGWQQNRFLARQLPLFLDDAGQMQLSVQRGDRQAKKSTVECVFSYSRERGLEVHSTSGYGNQRNNEQS